MVAASELTYQTNASAMQMAEAIFGLLESKDKKLSIEEAARKDVEGPLSFKQRLENVEDVYLNLLGKGS